MAKAIQLKDSNNLALLPITDSKLVQHWNGTSYVDTYTYLGNLSHKDHNHQIGMTGDITLSQTNLSTSLSPTVNKATNLKNGAALQIAYQTAANTTGFVTAPSTSGHFLKYDGTKLVWSADNNDNDKVKVYGLSDNTNHPILFRYTGGANASTTGDTTNYVGADSDGTTNLYYNPSTNILHAKYVNSDDSASVPTGITSNLNYVQGKDITLDNTFLSNALGSTTSNITGSASSGTASVIVNHAAS